MASALSSCPSFFSFSPQNTLTCPVSALTFSLPPPPPCASLTFSLSCAKAVIAGFNYIYSNLPLPHDSPVPCLISAKGTNPARIEYQVWARGELLKEREGGWRGRRKEDGKTDRARSTETESRQEEAEIIIQEVSSFTPPHPDQAIFAMRTKFSGLPPSFFRYQVSKRLSDSHKDASIYGEIEQDGCMLTAPRQFFQGHGPQQKQQALVEKSGIPVNC